jgi:CubicO group peptidase (beta-lactamase class C family)
MKQGKTKLGMLIGFRILGAILALGLSSCTALYRAVQFPDATIWHFPMFERDTIHPRGASAEELAAASDSLHDTPKRFEWVRHPAATWVQLPPAAEWMTNSKGYDSTQTAEALLDRIGTAMFIVARNDTILYERYFNGYDPDEPVMVFSLSKAVVGLLAGVALGQGLIHENQPVIDWMPELQGQVDSTLVIGHLLNMSSGLNHNDYSMPIKLLRIFFGTNLDALVKGVRHLTQPGRRFVYKTLDTQILGTVLERVYQQPLPRLVEQHLWQPLGLSRPSYWALDHAGGRAKMGSGLITHAEDLLTLGRLLLQGGVWGENQVVPPNYVADAGSRDTSMFRPWWGYHNGFWLPQGGDPHDLQDYFAAGFHGQTLYIDPQTNTIILRLGERDGGYHWGYSARQLSRHLQPNAPHPDPHSPEAHARRLSWQVDSLQVAPYLGTWRSPSGQAFTLSYANHQLWYQGPKTKKPLPLYPEPGTGVYLNFRKWMSVSLPALPNPADQQPARMECVLDSDGQISYCTRAD